MKFFYEIKRIVSQFFEARYWYIWRNKPSYWYNEDTHKYEQLKKPYCNYNILQHTWEGEDDILDIMVRKIEHMHHNLKHNSMHQDLYILASDIINYEYEGAKELKEKYFNKILASHSDKVWYEDVYGRKSDTKSDYFYRKISKFKLFVGKINEDRYYLSFNVEHFDDGTVRINESFLIKSKPVKEEKSEYKTLDIKARYVLYCPDNKLYIKSFSTSGDMSFTKEKESALSYDYLHDATSESESVKTNFDISTTVERRYDYSNKDSTNTVYKDSIDMDYSNYNLKEIEKIINAKFKSNLNLIDEVISSEHTINLTIKEYSELPNTLKQLKVMGNRVTLKQLLHLRHLIKKIKRISDLDEKYSPHTWPEYADNWDNIPDEEKRELYKKAGDMYMEDRKKAYIEMAAFMAEHGNCWWD